MNRLSIVAVTAALAVAPVAAHASTLLLLVEQVTGPQGQVGFVNETPGSQIDITSIMGTGTNFIGTDQAGTVPASISWVATQLPSLAQDSFSGSFSDPVQGSFGAELTGEITDTSGLFRDATAVLIEDVVRTQNRVSLEITATPNPAPEMSTWAMMLAGFLALFFVAKRRSSVA